MSDESDPQVPIPRATEPMFLTRMRFDDLELPPEVLSGLDKAGFVNCTPIQAQVLPVSLTGKDVAGQAQTGTGKTAAFLVTLFTRLQQQAGKEAKLPSALVVAPTRELALQIYEEACLLGVDTGLRFAQVVGGVGRVENGGAAIPGRREVVLDSRLAGSTRKLDMKHAFLAGCKQSCRELGPGHTVEQSR